MRTWKEKLPKNYEDYIKNEGYHISKDICDKLQQEDSKRIINDTCISIYWLLEELERLKIDTVHFGMGQPFDDNIFDFKYKNNELTIKTKKWR